jgi:hypothetical protein
MESNCLDMSVVGAPDQRNRGRRQPADTALDSLFSPAHFAASSLTQGPRAGSSAELVRRSIVRRMPHFLQRQRSPVLGAIQAATERGGFERTPCRYRWDSRASHV